MATDTESEVKLIRYAAEVLVQAQNIVAFTGQGISPIPDLCREWIDLDQFLADPLKVWQEYNQQRQKLKSTPPTAAHDALAEMEFILEKFFVITQNIDGLHQAACSMHLVEIHGDLHRTRCISCDYQTDEPDLGGHPRCPLCSHWLRPDVVWPDEPLPEEEFSTACEACENADLLLSIGNEAEMQPSASMIWQAKATGATLIEINSDFTAASHLADIRIAEDPQKALPDLVFAIKDILHRPLVP